MRSVVDTPDFRGFTPLMLAGYRGNLSELEELIGQGANPNLTDPVGNTPLMGVAYKANLEVIILRKGGTDLNLKNQAGMDAYDLAKSFGRKSIIEYFEKLGVTKPKISKFRIFYKLIIMGFRKIVRIVFR